MKYLSLLMLFSALATIPANSADALRGKLAPYQKIEVAPFRNKVGENLDKEAIHDLESRVVAAINESKLLTATFNSEFAFPKKDQDDDSKLSYQGSGNAEDSKTLMLLSEIITFNKGSRAKRYLAGPTGRAELRGNCYLLDKKTGEQLFYFQTFGETNWGLLGGGSDKTLKGYASRIVNFLKGKD